MSLNPQPETPGAQAFAEVALPVPLARSFTYRIPDELQESIAVGSRVEVPFGRRVLSGIVINITAETNVKRIKPIGALYDTFLPETLLKITKWIASYYGCSVGEAAQAVLPPSLKKSKAGARIQGVLTLERNASGDGLARAKKQAALVDALMREGGKADVTTVVKEWGFSKGVVKGLIGRGAARLNKRVTVSALSAIDRKVHALSPDQTKALESIYASIASGRFAPILLYGVTGSGKTELYLRAAHATLSQDGGCIVLVPEIGLLPQAIARYRQVFGDDMAILHSRMTGAERFEMWHRIATGECRLVLGPRSAIFSPVKNLKLIVVDEEQDDSYKQEDKPRYHARNVALMRGKFENLTVILGSATPSAESLHHARSGRYQYLKLPERVSGGRLPLLRFVDMGKAEMEGAFFSSELLERIDHNLKRGNQTILFLNRRGHARYVQCNACSHVERCQNCDISLIYHRVNHRLLCHFCGYAKPAMHRCAKCGSSRLYFSGVGTQRVELDLTNLLPGVGILRMDADTTAGRDGHGRILEQFSTGNYPILIGTQMVAKGHHFPGVNLVGVLMAEDSLNYPDFRSAERTFHQLTQVAGRAGRVSSEGEVVVQTFIPDHPVFEFLRNNDYDGFMSEELKVRKQLNYPPFSRVILASCSAPNQPLLERVVGAWVSELRRRPGRHPAEILGPVPPVIPRIRNRYRQQVMIKGQLSNTEKARLLGAFGDVVGHIRGGASVDLKWDVDPESFF